MKDTSKANWPEGMVENSKKSKWGIGIGTRPLVYDVLVYADIDSEREHRARQICALPQMVALLNLITEQIGEDGGTGPDVDKVLSEAYDILRSIGEVE